MNTWWRRSEDILSQAQGLSIWKWAPQQTFPHIPLYTSNFTFLKIIKHNNYWMIFLCQLINVETTISNLEKNNLIYTIAKQTFFLSMDSITDEWSVTGNLLPGIQQRFSWFHYSEDLFLQFADFNLK